MCKLLTIISCRTTAFVLVTALASKVIGQTGTLAEPFAPPSPNAALQYQQGLLYLAAIDDSLKFQLQRPIWELEEEVATDRFDAELKRLLYQGRFAIRNASSGSRLATCDFGIDYREHGAGTPMVHAMPMVELGRLLTLRGAAEQARGDWEQAAVIYFDGLRMGRHMTHQSTVIETLAGLEILRNNYYALARWAVECPEPKMVARARRLLETLAIDMTAPTKTVAGELSVLSQRLVGLNAAYPNGPWAELILEDLGEEIPAGKLNEIRELAKAAAIEEGVPGEAFESVGSFRNYLNRLTEIHTRFSESAAACMTLPTSARISQGFRLYENYTKRVGALGSDVAFNPGELGALFASHDAELALARVALAVCASTNEGRFPADLEEVARLFGGALPTSPYDGSAIGYTVNEEGFTLRIEAMTTDHIALPAASFESIAPNSPVE